MIERHVAEGETIIARQQALIVSMESAGHCADTARSLLYTYLSSQALHREHLCRIQHKTPKVADRK
uniref:hypothetical protein n=1 Tax=uncultured Sphingomonas sp. TaxID=158754 RepID=UPI0035C9F7AA